MQQTSFTAKAWNSIDGSHSAGEEDLIEELGIPFLGLTNGDILVIDAAVRNSPNSTPDPLILTIGVGNDDYTLGEIELPGISDGNAQTTSLRWVVGMTDGHFKAALLTADTYDVAGNIDEEKTVTTPEVTTLPPAEMSLYAIGDIDWTDQLLYCVVTRIRAAL